MAGRDEEDVGVLPGGGVERPEKPKRAPPWFLLNLLKILERAVTAWAKAKMTFFIFLIPVFLAELINREKAN